MGKVFEVEWAGYDNNGMDLKGHIHVSPIGSFYRSDGVRGFYCSAPLQDGYCTDPSPFYLDSLSLNIRESEANFNLLLEGFRDCSLICEKDYGPVFSLVEMESGWSEKQSCFFFTFEYLCGDSNCWTDDPHPHNHWATYGYEDKVAVCWAS